MVVNKCTIVFRKGKRIILFVLFVVATKLQERMTLTVHLQDVDVVAIKRNKAIEVIFIVA